jgi:hypothetical protein
MNACRAVAAEVTPQSKRRKDFFWMGEERRVEGDFAQICASGHEAFRAMADSIAAQRSKSRVSRREVAETGATASVADHVAQRFVAGLPPGCHPRKHRDRGVNVVVDDDVCLVVVSAVQAPDILSERPLPGYRHRQEQGVEARIVESFT